MTGPISIHALLAESDPLVNMRSTLSPVFLSTLSLRRATDDLQVPESVSKISIHALLAESDKDTTARQQIADISIHALLAESDLIRP